LSAQIISGTEIAGQIKKEISQEIINLKAQYNLVPGLAVVLVGDNPASKSYVTGKDKAAKALGIYSQKIELPGDTTEEQLLELIRKLNRDPLIHGILVQIPLPAHISETRIIGAIDPAKDADGLHPANLGKLMLGEPRFIPCTPYGILKMLEYYDIKVEGANVVIVGRSNLVGKPLANLLLQKRDFGNATVTICHTGTRDLKAHTLQADILIAAMGKPQIITADMVKEGAVVIDVGINRVGKTPEGKDILVGDVDFAQVKEKALAVTPVPGGVGAMTVTMLMLNTLKAAKMSRGLA